MVTQVTANPTQTMAASVQSSNVHHQLFMPANKRVGPGQAGQEIPLPPEMQGDAGGRGTGKQSGRGSKGWARPPAVFVQKHSSGTRNNN